MRPGIALVGIALAGACGAHPVDPFAMCDEPRGSSPGWFENVTAGSGIDFAYNTPDFKGGGLAVADFDGDGRADVVAGRRDGGLRLFRNLGELRFEERDGVGLDAALAVTAIAAADLDNDDDKDLVVASHGIARVFGNRGDGTFVLAAVLEGSGTTEHVLPVDLDGDGLLDLHLGNYDLANRDGTLNRVYMNRGGLDLAFAGTTGAGKTWTTSAFDYDGDGDQDLYVANDTLSADFGDRIEETRPFPVDQILRNDGLGPDGLPRFTDVGVALGLGEPASSMGGVLGDFDDDGRFDFYVPNYGAKKLFVHDPAGGFVDRAAELGLAAIARRNAECGPDPERSACLLLSWSAALSDFDLDGYDEILVVNGETEYGKPPPVLLFTRGPELPYRELSPDMPCMDARGLVVTDLDSDGDQDVVVAHKAGPLEVYETLGRPAPGTWLSLRLRGQTSNRDGVGAVVTLHMKSGRTQLRAVGAGGVIHSSGPAEAFFGLGGDAIAGIEIRWPSGARTKTLANPAGSVIWEAP